MWYLLRLQAAMEYLMTYGWAILIIAVVLGVLFQLGVFGSGGLLGTACIAAPGYQCSTPVLGSNGNLSFTFGQSTGSAIYNVGFACVATTATSGLPGNSVALVLIDTGLGTPAGGGASSISASPTGNALKANVLTVLSGQTLSISNLKCFGSNNQPVTSATAPIGTAFGGSLFMNYTSTSVAANAIGSIVAGNWLTTKIATLSLKVA